MNSHSSSVCDVLRRFLAVAVRVVVNVTNGCFVCAIRCRALAVAVLCEG